VFFLPRAKSPAGHAAWAAVYLSIALTWLTLDHLFHDFDAIDLLPVALAVRHIIAALVQILRWPPDS
jgi:hypothetical protein